MKAIEKRVVALEASQPSHKAAGGLDREIAVMTLEERQSLKRFLQHWRDGGKEGDPEYERLMAPAEAAVMAARYRYQSIGEDGDE